MDANLERIIVTLVIVSFSFTSLSLLSIPEVPLTREEAIEISKGSSLVQEGLAIAYGTSIEALYHNSTEVEQKKEGPSRYLYENVPEGHSVWEIRWYIGTGIGGYVIGVIVDAEVGVIITEVKGAIFL